MKRMFATMSLIVLGAAFFVAYAGGTSGAHFFSYDSQVLNNGQLAVTFDEAGLGNGDINYTLTADAIYDWGCINGGGNHPQASNKETQSTPVSGGATLQVKNGRVSGTVLAPDSAPQPPSNFSCPGGMTLVLADASYTNIVLTDTNNSLSVDVPDASATFIKFKK